MIKWIPVIIFLASFLTVLGLTPFVRRLAHAWDVMDRPGPLKLQTSPIAYLGGLAIYAGLLVGLSMAHFIRPTLSSSWLIGLLGGGALLAASGLRDDMDNSSAWERLAVEFAVGLAFVLLIHAPWPLAVGLSFLIPVGCNAMNLIDGQDGLAAGMAALFGLGGAWLGIYRGDAGMTLLGITLLGACLGFLKFNWNPASILMGDCGSLLLGFWIAAMAIYWILGHISIQRGAQMALFFAFPLIDTALAALRRIVRRRNAFEGDRDHLYDVLSRSGLGTTGSTYLCLILASLVACWAFRLAP